MEEREKKRGGLCPPSGLGLVYLEVFYAGRLVWSLDYGWVYSVWCVNREFCGGASSQHIHSVSPSLPPPPPPPPPPTRFACIPGVDGSANPMLRCRRASRRSPVTAKASAAGGAPGTTASRPSISAPASACIVAPLERVGDAPAVGALRCTSRSSPACPAAAPPTDEPATEAVSDPASSPRQPAAGERATGDPTLSRTRALTAPTGDDSAAGANGDEDDDEAAAGA
jgi:hypothetical protein